MSAPQPLTAESFMAWRRERTDLALLEGDGVLVGWESRPGGGVILVDLSYEGSTLRYRSIAEAGAFVDGYVVRDRAGCRP